MPHIWFLILVPGGIRQLGCKELQSSSACFGAPSPGRDPPSGNQRPLACRQADEPGEGSAGPSPHRLAHRTIVTRYAARPTFRTSEMGNPRITDDRVTA